MDLVSWPTTPNTMHSGSPIKTTTLFSDTPTSSLLLPITEQLSDLQEGPRMHISIHLVSCYHHLSLALSLSPALLSLSLSLSLSFSPSHFTVIANEEALFPDPIIWTAHLEVHPTIIEELDANGNVVNSALIPQKGYSFISATDAYQTQYFIFTTTVLNATVSFFIFRLNC